MTVCFLKLVVLLAFLFEVCYGETVCRLSNKDFTDVNRLRESNRVETFCSYSDPNNYISINTSSGREYVCPPSLCRPPHDGVVVGRSRSRSRHVRPRGTGGTVFYQGDIVLNQKMSRQIYGDDGIRRLTKRATTRNRASLWENGIVVYTMAKTIEQRAKVTIEKAMRHIRRKTCIQFKEKTTRDKDYIRFISETGCWSAGIGRIGGQQLISLGPQCYAELGIAVHEIVHGLGLWHEQSRADRDKYVQILEDNISENFKFDFEKYDKQLSTSMGYPYDYNSVMHYSGRAFAKTGRPTIKVKGIGAKLGTKIGQRKGLSTIDMSQLRDMYKCNKKMDRKVSVCRDGFKKIANSCYKFYPEIRLQFAPAFKTCQSVNSHLVTIDNRREQKLLTGYLSRKYKHVSRWRTAGRKTNAKMVWYIKERSTKKMSDFTNWAQGHPGKYTTVILERVNETGEFLWVGEWSGSAKQKPRYQHAFICEKHIRRKCVIGQYEDGRDYRGNLDHTKEGHTCQKWTENYPHNHTLVAMSKVGTRKKGRQNNDGLGDHNRCRNPSTLRRNRPWCFTSKRNHEWEYCDISICAASINSYNMRLHQTPRKRKSTFPKPQTLSLASGNKRDNSREDGTISIISGKKRHNSRQNVTHNVHGRDITRKKGPSERKHIRGKNMFIRTQKRLRNTKGMRRSSNWDKDKI